MNDRARELLERAADSLDGGLLYRLRLKEEIRTYLSEKQDQPKPKFDSEPVKEILHTLLGTER